MDKEWKGSHTAAHKTTTRKVRFVIDAHPRGWWVTVNNCARRRGTSIICNSNLPSLPWNITSMVHKIRITLKRRSIFLACTGKPLPPQRGKIKASSKAAKTAAATAAAILHRCIRESSLFIWKKKSIERTKFGLQFLNDWRAEDTPLTLIFLNVWFNTMTHMKKKCSHTHLRRRFLGGVIRIGRCLIPSLKRKIHCVASTVEDSREDLKLVAQKKNQVLWTFPDLKSAVFKKRQ